MDLSQTIKEVEQLTSRITSLSKSVDEKAEEQQELLDNINKLLNDINKKREGSFTKYYKAYSEMINFQKEKMQENKQQKIILHK